MKMESYLPLVSGLIGAIIGSASSIATLIIQAYYQQKREFKKLAVQLAMEDFKFRIANESERIVPASAPVLIGYWDKMIDLVISGKLSPKTMREVLEYDGELKSAIMEAYQDWWKEHQQDSTNKSNSVDAKSRAAD
jgi:hypothetical protein